MGRFNISKISKSILEFYFLRVSPINDRSCCYPNISNTNFPWNETKRLVSNPSYLGCSNSKLNICSRKFFKFLSLSKTRPEKNIDHISSRDGDMPFRSSLILQNKSRRFTYFRYYSLLHFILIWNRTNLLDSYFWNDTRINHRSSLAKCINFWNNHYHNYSHTATRRWSVSLFYLLWIN